MISESMAKLIIRYIIAMNVYYVNIFQLLYLLTLSWSLTTLGPLSLQIFLLGVKQLFPFSKQSPFIIRSPTVAAWDFSHRCHCRYDRAQFEK